MKKVLIVMTSQGRLGYTADRTGLWLDEFTAAYYRFMEAGFRITAVSPAGGTVPIDPRSIQTRALSQESRRFLSSADPVLDRTEKLTTVNPNDFDAVFYPGGHGPMWDLADSRRNAFLVSRFYELKRPIAAVCHGPAALLKARRQDGYPIVFSKHLTGFSNSEERGLGYENIVPFLLADRLSELGAIYTSGSNWRPHVVIDGNLITGQNPHSAAGTAEALIRMLNDPVPLALRRREVFVSLTV